MLLYVLGALVPPLAILMYGKIAQAAVSGLLWTYAMMTPGIVGMVIWIGASIHASYIIRHARSAHSDNYSV